MDMRVSVQSGNLDIKACSLLTCGYVSLPELLRPCRMRHVLRDLPIARALVDSEQVACLQPCLLRRTARLICIGLLVTCNVHLRF
jgi:hypothetical protein